MRLQKLHLTRFGRFTSTSLDFAPPALGAPDLHIIYGPNEAGKSTLFAAWLDMLFGIHAQSRYAYLHAGPNMEIGAEITHEGGKFDLIRRKGRGNTLADRAGNGLPDSILAPLLNGLSREKYSAMFSLDDETIEAGGEEILASGGELGQLLFSASAGLAGLSSQLEAHRTALDGFYRKGKRSGGLFEAKKELTALAESARQLETTAAEQKRRARALEEAQAGWRKAKAQETSLRKELEALQAALSALPLKQLLAQAQADLTKLGPLPEPSKADEASLADITQATAQLEERKSGIERQIQRLEADRAALQPDPIALALGDQISAGDMLRSAHDNVYEQLPRRKEALKTLEAEIADLLALLGKAGSDPAQIMLSLDHLAQLQDHLAKRSGLQTAHEAARSEHQTAVQTLAEEKERAGEQTALSSPAEEAALARLLAELEQAAPDHQRRLAAREAQDWQDKRQAALAALRPWQGTSDDLQKLTVPTQWQMAAWKEARAKARETLGLLHHESANLTEQINTYRQALGEESEGPLGFNLAQVVEARSHREALWAAHLSELSARSAQAFERALRQDDHFTTLMAEAIARHQRAKDSQLALQRLSEKLHAIKAQETAADQALAKIDQEISDSCAALSLHGADFSALEDWLLAHQEALRLHDQAHLATSHLQKADLALSQAAQKLARALAKEDQGADYSDLWTEAQQRLRHAERRQEARERLQRLTQDVQKRQRDEEAAHADWALWLNQWQVLSAQTLLADLPSDSQQIGTKLKHLTELEGKCREKHGMTHRITTMQADIDNFIAAKAQLIAALALPDNSLWSDITARYAAARKVQETQENLVLAAQSLQDQLKSANAALEDQAAAKAALAQRLHWQADSGESLAQRLDHCLHASRLRAEITRLSSALQSSAQKDRQEDEEEGSLQAKAEALTIEVEAARQESESLQSLAADARHALDQIGADDGLARTLAARENLRLSLAEEAKDHLARRFGLLALDHALLRYRESHQSAMLAKASEAFETLSLGAYPKLEVSSQANSERLVALTRDGASKRAVDLSKGTRFQLYLALRIAGYYELAKSRPSVPFIADDIMETFDDERAAAAFHLLSDMSRQGQVIYLTHHPHLCQIAKKVCPSANIIDLQAL